MVDCSHMGLLDRLFGRAARPDGDGRYAKPSAVVVLQGLDTLEVVGESQYQDDLWRLVGGVTAERVRCAATAVLVPEPDNPYDSNAVKVVIDGHLVGYLARHDAALYLPGLRQLMARHSCQIALTGHIVGGGQRDDGLGMLGVFLDHNPADFGLRASQTSHIGELRTGLSQALTTDLEDDRYDLSWHQRLSGRHTPSDVIVLRRLLASEKDPIDRHFMLAELGKCLYKSRDAFASALDEFDAVCVQHDAEMEVIRSALYEKFGCVPVLEMYRQAAIRCQKARDWQRMRFWAARGLALYGRDAARPEAVADLHKRFAHADAKVSAPSTSRPAEPIARSVDASAARTRGVTETLVCSDCGAQFQRVRTRGRKPLRCPGCRGTSDDPDSRAE
jgi:predicted Zn-ribbon and HTH transcriptional regulator